MKKLNFLQILIIFILSIIFIYSVFVIIRWYLSNNNTKKLQSNIIDDVVTTDNNNIANGDTNIDFKKLKAINNETIGWILIKNTNINYPIVKTSDNEKYLTTSFDGKYNSCGWIFMDYRNSGDFNDINTIVYGHNLTTGLMFYDLQKIYNGSLGNNITVNIFTEENIFTYNVISCYQIDPKDNISTPYLTHESFSDFKNNVLNMSKISFNTYIPFEDKLLTLLTCDTTGKKRIVVHAILTSKTPSNNN